MTMPRLPRVVVAMLGVGFAAAAALEIAVWLRPSAYTGPLAEGGGTARTRGWFTHRGAHPAEFESHRAVSFSWTTERLVLLSPRLSRKRTAAVDVVLRSGRGPSLPAPHVVGAVDDIEVVRTPLGAELTTLTLRIPPTERDGVRITLTVTPTFVPGTKDPRSLGAIIERVTLRPEDGGRIVVPWSALATVALAASAVLGIGLLCGTSLRVASIGAGVAGLLHGWLLSLDAAFLGTFSTRLLWLWAGGIAVASVACVFRQTVFRHHGYPEWPVAAFVVLAATGLKLAFFGHPAAVIGDSMFHVHRAEWVTAGRYFFTSVTPRPFFEFPYAIGLYITALPFNDFFPSKLDRVLLLRGLAVVADAGVGFACYLVARRVWHDHVTGIVAALLLPFSRMSLQTLCTANLTNAFSQAVFSFAVLFAVWRAGRGNVVVSTMAMALLLAYGFLSHFSTFSIGVPLTAAAALTVGFAVPPDVRRTQRWMAAALLLASLLSYGVYYSHFHEVYRSTVSRVATREGEAAQRSMVAPVYVKIQRYAASTLANFGAPTLAAAAVGMGLLVARRRRDVLTMVGLGWIGTVAAFALLGIFTAIEMRANLAIIPVLTLSAAVAIGTGLAHHRLAVRALAAVTLVACVGDGLLDWFMCLGGSR